MSLGQTRNDEGGKIIIKEEIIRIIMKEKKKRRRSFNHRSVISVLVHTVQAISVPIRPEKAGKSPRTNVWININMDPTHCLIYLFMSRGIYILSIGI